jgi:histidinol-phosphate aminotransferase
MATAFREQAAKLLGLEPDWLLAGNGSDDLLTILTRSFVGPGERILAPTPSYVLYKSLAEIQGAQYTEVPFTDAWDLPDEFVRTDAKLAFIPNPISPSGTVLSIQRLREIASRLEPMSPLVIDEAYTDFAEANCIALVREFPNVIVTRTLSKSYSLAGVRFGYATARPGIIAGMTKVKDSYNCDAISIAAATAAIAEQDYLQKGVARIRATRQRLSDSLRRLGFAVPDSQANFVWCTDGPAPAKALYEQLKQQRILVRYMKYPCGIEGLRISIGTDAEIDRLLDAMKGVA